ncbi:hypothetical protein [Streptomyces sp. NPDC044948]|uniref:hypothetical protein n=1 Tax=Streptomyces sp. NPDC044948 TaxID=3157092 RepID=UPI0033DED09A
MSAPVAVNTADGTCWTRRGVLRGGEALYAPEGVCSCPPFVMATLAEPAEHGIRGSADALPMPVGPTPSDGFRFPLFYLADYEGAGLTLHLTREAARAACDDFAKAEAHGQGWDWRAEDGVDFQFWTDPDTDRPTGDTGGAVWEVHVEDSTGPRTYPPALPWAKHMDADDLEEFLADLVDAASGDDDLTTLAAVEDAIGRWRLIGEAQHAHNTAPGPDAEAGEPS